MKFRWVFCPTGFEGEIMAVTKSSTLATALVGAAGGALALYLLDPDSGKDRRHRIAAAANDAVDHARQHLQHHIDSLAELARDHAAKAQNGTCSAMQDAMDPARKAAASHIANAAAAAADARSFVSDAWGKAQAAIEEAARRGRRAKSALRGEEHSHANAVVPVVLGAALFCAAGVGLMWALDPDKGRGRRAQMSQQARHLLIQTGHRFNRTGRHLRNKMRGYAAVARRNVNDRLSSHEPEPAQG